MILLGNWPGGKKRRLFCSSSSFIFLDRCKEMAVQFKKEFQINHRFSSTTFSDRCKGKAVQFKEIIAHKYFAHL
jgi:hypothetical protein